MLYIAFVCIFCRFFCYNKNHLSKKTKCTRGVRVVFSRARMRSSKDVFVYLRGGGSGGSDPPPPRNIQIFFLKSEGKEIEKEKKKECWGGGYLWG